LTVIFLIVYSDKSTGVKLLSLGLTFVHVAVERLLVKPNRSQMCFGVLLALVSPVKRHQIHPNTIGWCYDSGSSN
jgi:hypothetical protein